MEYGSRYPFWPKARPWEFPWKRNLRHVRVSGGGDRVSGLGSMLYGPTLRGHVPSDLAFRSHHGSSLELSCSPELGGNFSGYRFSREFLRLAIDTKSRAEGPAFGVCRESWEFRWKRNSPGNGFEDMSS